MSQCRCLLMEIRGSKEISRGRLIVTEGAGESDMGTDEMVSTARESGKLSPPSMEDIR